MTGAVAAVTAVSLAPAADAATATPTITSLSATSGRVSGGARITLSGTAFARGATVVFGSTAGTSVSVVSATRLSVLVPAHAAGVVDVRVTVAGKRSAVTTRDRYTYVKPPVVTSVSPNVGLVDGGSPVTVLGTGFTPTSAVNMGGDRVQMTYVSSTRLTIIPRPHGPERVDVRVTSVYGTSAVSAGTGYTYRTAPAPVTSLRLAAVSAGTATLRWTASPTADVSDVVVRRSAGATAPADPAAGAAVATVAAPGVAVTDSGLQPASAYSYAVFARTATGSFYSTAATITVITARNSAPDVPALNASGGLRGLESGCTVTAPCGIGSLGPGPLTLEAQVSDPEGDTQTITTRFRFWKATPDGARTYLIGPTDDAGLTPARSGSGSTAFVRYYPPSDLDDSTVYGFDAVSTDNLGASSTAGPLYFRIITSRPDVVAITSPDSSFHRGVTAHLHFSTNTSEATGPASFDHFVYSFTSYYDGTALAGTKNGTRADADLTFTPGAWGTNYLYVYAVNVAGNRSSTNVYEYYVIDR